jgi:threonyl-tRNA synthetase
MSEVKTPQVVDRKLWEAVGPLGELPREHVHRRGGRGTGCRGKAVNALKPMNCPCHVQIFNQG